MMKKKNCWEVMGCRKQFHGFTPGESGICPAFHCKPLNGIHGGMNGGRACWMVTGTMCGNKIQGSYGFKVQNCSQCGFFNQVIEEEGSKYVPPETLLTKNEKTV
ncbi:MAG: hypothetical protein EHM54_00285 [Nitrospiraceae bacterium]|nr:MAG: hypothetical protein EHM54_00285 [Nitrospiraceae bacterium]